jgi:sulfate permease, SulP family
MASDGPTPDTGLPAGAPGIGRSGAAGVAALRPVGGTLRHDLVAGLTFAVVNVPQAMGHALLATVNPVVGIYTLMVAAPVGALCTGSVFMNVSTTSALAVATAAGLSAVGSADRTAALATLVLLVGILQLLAGLLRLGFFARFVPNSVMTGFLNGVAVLIILGQLPDLTGFDSDYSSRVAKALDLMLHPLQVDLPSTVIGVATLALILALNRTRLSKFALMLGIVVATLCTAALGWATVGVVGDMASIPRGLPTLVLPSLSLVLPLLVPAVSIAIIGLIQGAGISQAYPNPDGRYPDISRDFAGQGMANLATSLVGGIPAGGSASGTAVVLGAGARTRWANAFSGAFVVAVVLLLAPFVEQVPMPALAALLIVSAYQSLRLGQAITVWETSRAAATMMGITFVATLIMPLQYAVLLGVALSIVLYVFNESNRVLVRELVPVAGGFPIERPAPARLPGHRVTVLQLYGSIFFAAAKSLEDLLPIPGDSRRAVVIVGLRGRTEIGSTFVTVVQRYAAQLQEHDSLLMLVGVEPAVLAQLTHTGTLDLLGPDHVFPVTPQLFEAHNQALTAAEAWLAAAPQATAPAPA